ncbi:MAG: hypothetical protein HBSAPP02_15180 [Phycisphaerae bacterium]|nr:MAG: glutamate synthase [Planctomycetia bacterium]RIK71365.1 MAG: glutamate synthase [Planctomycetota bacterium]GJQ26486.1 MAG: hypothetical protein HBSAPP02_15180 [Phycisphaerae bacterium]
MAELVPAPFADLVRRLYLEPSRQGALFELPRNRWYAPADDGPDLSVAFHGHRAGNPLGPAAGPHTQMAQNILLSYAAGGRILELKTVQVNDRLTIGRPCIDVTNVGYNIEWSQELRIAESIREYVAGAMLIDMFRSAHPDGPAGNRGPAGDVVYDLSVGYDLAGIRGDAVRGFLDAMIDARPMVEKLRAEIPAEFTAARDLKYPARISDGITLSTFHGCPADEIERICEFLMGEYDFNVIVKMNPPMLGKERLEHLLHDVLGYTELTVNPEAYRTGLGFDEGVQLCRRLSGFAAARGRTFGAKFSNTLEVLNHRDFFTPDNKVMYLSGQPLHVITMTLTDEFRRAMGAEFPISFSAGIDAQNFPSAVACGFVPITTSTDLLRPGGYGRMPAYLDRLSAEMRKLGAATMNDYIIKRSASDRADANRSSPQRAAGFSPRGHSIAEESFARRTNAARAEARGSLEEVKRAELNNTTLAAEQARNDPRYRAENNRKVPKRIDSHLETFDCITCDKCLPVCPNAANFTYPTPQVAFDYHDIIVSPINGDARSNTLTSRAGESRRFEITESMQIACYSDFCNECGNCDTFCPEYGGPYIKKPTFFGTERSWEQAAPRDGFVIGRSAQGPWIRGRIKGRVFRLMAVDGHLVLDDGVVVAEFDGATHALKALHAHSPLEGEHTLDLWAYHTMRHLMAGVLDSSRVNQVNVHE